MIHLKHVFVTGTSRTSALLLRGRASPGVVNDVFAALRRSDEQVVSGGSDLLALFLEGSKVKQPTSAIVASGHLFEVFWPVGKMRSMQNVTSKFEQFGLPGRRLACSASGL